jgi:hypothetical protein
MKKTIATITLTAVMTLGSTFANAGIIMSGRTANGTPCTVDLDRTGIIMSGLTSAGTGIIMSGLTGAGTGIIMSGLAATGIIMSGLTSTDGCTIN